MNDKQFKGTPGLWIEEDCAVYAENGSDIAAIYDGLPTDIHNMDRGIAQANTRLIAAAPELLDALMEIQSIWVGLVASYPTLKNEKVGMMMENAINKALGE